MGLVHHPNVVTDGIKFYWDAANRRSSPGTGSDGTAWTDLIKGKIGTLDNQATFTTHKGGYVEFDGTDDSVQIPNDADFTMPAGDWTICVWCADLGGNTDKRHIVGTYGSYPRWVIRDTDDFGAGWAFVTNSGDGWEKAYSTVDIQDTDDEWHYLVVTGSAGGSSGSLKLYTDGVDTSVSSSYAVESITRSPGAITMGITISNGHDFMGYIASVAIYSRILTPAEVKQNYEATKSRFLPRITKSGLVGNWDAGDPASYVGGLTCKDTANGTTATFTNWDAGEAHFNSANGGYWEFDGTDQYIQCSTDSVLQPQSFSVEAWVKDDQTEHYLPIVGWKNDDYPSVWTSYHGSTQRPMIYMNSADYRYFNNTAASVAGWHHVVFTYTYDDITTGAFYVDGVSIGSYYTTDSTKASTNTCTIGATLHPSSPQYYKGSMGLVRIYDTPLSAAEIMDNFQKTRGRFGV